MGMRLEVPSSPTTGLVEGLGFRAQGLGFRI